MNKNILVVKNKKFYKTIYSRGMLIGGIMLLGVLGGFAQTYEDTLPSPINKNVLNKSAASPLFNLFPKACRS
jgi:hypothetical protein